MSETKRTPGPWTIEIDREFHKMSIRGSGYHTVTEFREGRSGAKRGQSPVYRGFYPVDEADARLIAAVPDLLEACKQALDRLEDAVARRNGMYGDDFRAIENLRVAIAKAEGKEL